MPCVPCPSPNSDSNCILLSWPTRLASSFISSKYVEILSLRECFSSSTSSLSQNSSIYRRIFCSFFKVSIFNSSPSEVAIELMPIECHVSSKRCMQSCKVSNLGISTRGDSFVQFPAHISRHFNFLVLGQMYASRRRAMVFKLILLN